jgi:hypothetical protein
MIMNTPISAIAAFSVLGEVKPRYVQLEDESTHKLVNYKVEVEYYRDEIYVGIPTILFGCCIERNGQPERIKLRFHRNTTQWILIK